MIIAIGGVSTAGKTTLAGQLRNHFHNKKTSILCQDDFVKPVEQIPLIKNRINWEHPDSIEHIRLRDAIEAERRENDILIVEGLMIFWHPFTQSLFDKNIFIEIDYSLFRERKDNDYRWGDEPDWYVEHIWKSYLQFGVPTNRKNTHFVDGNKAIDLIPIINYIEQ